MTNTIYADHASTTFLSSAALDAMMPYLIGGFGNPSSIHSYGEAAAAAITKSRLTIAKILNCEPEEIIFTSGGTEANNHAAEIIGKYASSSGRNAVLTSGVEHHAVLSPISALSDRGVDVQIIDADRCGVVTAQSVSDVMRISDQKIAGGSFMLVNNETGNIFDICKISETVHSEGGIIHTDAVQAVGHIPVDFKSLNVDMMSLSAHKFHGPKGVGALICRKGLHTPSFIFGGAQEQGRRAGTENVAGIVGMAAALSEIAESIDATSRYVTVLRNMLIEGLTALGGKVNNPGCSCVPHILSIRFPGGDGEAIVRSLDLFGIAASAGAACNSTSVGVSHVLTSMGLSHYEAAATVRFSLDPSNTSEEIRRIISVMGELI